MKGKPSPDVHTVEWKPGKWLLSLRTERIAQELMDEDLDAWNSGCSILCSLGTLTANEDRKTVFLHGMHLGLSCISPQAVLWEELPGSHTWAAQILDSTSKDAAVRTGGQTALGSSILGGDPVCLSVRRWLSQVLLSLRKEVSKCLDLVHADLIASV